MFRLSGKAKNVLRGALVLCLVAAVTPNGFSETKYRRVYDSRTHKYVYVPEDNLKDKAKSAVRNPIVKQAAIGAAVGTAAGALSDRSSALKGAGVGALVGAGTGLIDTSRTLDGKPMVKSALKGAAIGTGTSAITDRSKVKGAVVGAGAGAGVHLLKDYLNRDNRDR